MDNPETKYMVCELNPYTGDSGQIDGRSGLARTLRVQSDPWCFDTETEAREWASANGYDPELVEPWILWTLKDKVDYKPEFTEWSAAKMQTIGPNSPITAEINGDTERLG